MKLEAWNVVVSDKVPKFLYENELIETVAYFQKDGGHDFRPALAAAHMQ